MCVQKIKFFVNLVQVKISFLMLIIFKYVDIWNDKFTLWKYFLTKIMKLMKRFVLSLFVQNLRYSGWTWHGKIINEVGRMKLITCWFHSYFHVMAVNLTIINFNGLHFFPMFSLSNSSIIFLAVWVTTRFLVVWHKI